MNAKIINLMFFTVGAAVGIFSTWRYMDNKYAKISNGEIDSVKEAYARALDNFKTNSEIISEEGYSSGAREIADMAKNKPDIVDFSSKIQKREYTNYSAISSGSNSEAAPKKSEQYPYVDDTNEDSVLDPVPFVITPEEFGEFEDYETISLTYYTDQILADDQNQLVENINDVVGLESLNSFGQYEDDSVFVRNHAMKCDYEILLDTRKYMEVMRSTKNRKPHEVID